MRNKTIYIFILSWIIPLVGLAQTDSIAKRFKKEFNSFNQTNQQKHQLFREKNDSVFSRFLQDSWASFDVMYKAKPVESKPVTQPKVELPTKEISVPSEEILIDSSKYSNGLKPAKTQMQVEKKQLPLLVESGGTATLNFDFYGNESKLTYPSVNLEIERISAESISEYFNQTSNSLSIFRLVS
ncbi:MAG TPA: hypothetical protein VF373_11120, partial [Prolixibacteraceae bacterium]